MDAILNFVLRAVDVTPSYEEARCIVVTRSTGACTACFDACPHDAVRITNRVSIDPVDCSGCGLCVQACPSGALEPRLSIAPNGNARCSKVAGSAQSVQCLARLQPSDIARLAGSKNSVTLGHGDCAACNIGSAAVPMAVAAVAARAQELSLAGGRELEVKVEQLASLDQRDAGDRLSRRSLLGGSVKSVKQAAGDVLAPLERILPPPEPTAAGDRVEPAVEHQRALRLLQIRDVPLETPVPFRLPRVADGCILCPICTRACPTDAFTRVLDPDGGVLFLDPERCVGCDACVAACPVKVITMDDEVKYGELTGGRQEAYRSDPERRAAGSHPR
ncbi:MAG TPA: 4Fe-4S binding protein [Trueperaceae bacterium]|nr:4Fe-4S binding protein [Trueperaceae bacterium]